MGFEDAINGLAGGHRQLEEQQGAITLQGVVNGLLTRHAPQAVGRLIANGQHLLHHQLMRLDGRMLACTRVTVADLFQRHSGRHLLAQATRPIF